MNDKNKGPTYFQVGSQLLKEWREWMLAKKKEINMSLCFGSITSISFGSPYSPDQQVW